MSRKYHSFDAADEGRVKDRVVLKEPLRTDDVRCGKEKRSRTLISGECRINRSIFLTFPEAAEFYSIGLITFRNIAKDSGAIKAVGRRKWINTNLFERYLEQFRI